MSKNKNSYQGSGFRSSNRTSKELNKALAKKRSKIPLGIPHEFLLWEYREKGHDESMTFEEFKQKKLKKYVEKQKKFREQRDKRLLQQRQGALHKKTKKKQEVQLSKKFEEYYENINKGKKP